MMAATAPAQAQRATPSAQRPTALAGRPDRGRHRCNLPPPRFPPRRRRSAAATVPEAAFDTAVFSAAPADAAVIAFSVATHSGRPHCPSASLSPPAPLAAVVPSEATATANATAAAQAETRVRANVRAAAAGDGRRPPRVPFATAGCGGWSLFRPFKCSGGIYERRGHRQPIRLLETQGYTSRTKRTWLLSNENRLKSPRRRAETRSASECL